MDQTKKTSPLRMIVWGLIGAVGIGAFIWAVLPGGDKGADKGSSSASLVDAVSKDDWQRGPADAAVTLVEFADVQCPACAQFQPMLDQLFKKYSNRVQFVYRHFPLKEIHANAILGARAAEAAGREGKLFPMLDALYNHQTEWAELAADNARAKMIELAKSVGLKQADFEKDLDSDTVASAVDADRASGDRSGVTGTPTFFLNGAKITNPTSVGAFSKLLDEALAAKK